MHVTWHIFTDCASEESARKVARSLLEKAEVADFSLSPQPYSKGGYRVTAKSSIAAISWPESVMLALLQAQRVGHSWTIVGDLGSELEAHSGSIGTVGVSFVEMHGSN